MHLHKSLKFLAVVLAICISRLAFAQQYKSFKLNAKGDTLNAITKDDLKQGKWVERVEELRGEPGFEEEGVYNKGMKEGLWRKYNLTGDLIAVENYLHGGKDGLQQYYNYLGDIEREENWKGFNPDSPYIFIPVYGTGSGEILEMKKVKAEPYSVKHGTWKYYEPGGRLLRTDEYLNNNLVLPKPKETSVSSDPPKKKEVPKTPEMIEWEKKNSGKKKALRDGKTSL